MMKPVLATLHKAIKGTWKDQCGRRIVTEQHNLSVQKFQRCTVRSLRNLILRKRRIPRFFRKLFKHATVKDTIYLIFFDTLLYLLQKFLMHQIIYIQNLQHRIGTHTHLIFFHFHSGITQSFSHKRRVCFYRI